MVESWVCSARTENDDSSGGYLAKLREEHAKHQAEILLEKLGNKCRQIGLRVLVDDDAEEVDLTEESVTRVVRRRPRAARMYADNELTNERLYVNVGVYDVAFNIHLEFEKMLYDPKTDDEYFAVTWEMWANGRHSGNKGYILQSVSEKLDEFIDEYLLANAACE